MENFGIGENKPQINVTLWYIFILEKNICIEKNSVTKYSFKTL